MCDVFAETFLRADAEENGDETQVSPATVSKPSALKHATAQLLERYGLNTRPRDLVRRIQNGEAKLLSYGVPGSGRLIYSVPVWVNGDPQNTVWVKVVYAPGDEIIVTVLPPRWKYQLRFDRGRERQGQRAQRRKSFAKDFRRQNSDAEEDFDS